MYRVCCITLLALIMVFAGCTQADHSELDLSDFQKGETFCYKGIGWGATIDEVEETLDISLQQMKEAATYYRPTKSPELYGQNSTSTYEFRGGFDGATFNFVPDADKNLNEFSEKVLSELEKLYGEAEKSDQIDKANRIAYRWMSVDSDGIKTTLQFLTYIRSDEISKVVLYVGRMRES